MTEYAEIAARFARDTAKHQMTVLHEDGLYRHIRFMNPQYGDVYHFALITWPNHLVIRGDGPNFMFAAYPTADPFRLFRESSHDGINPGYWQQKVIAGQVKDWSEDKFRTWLTQTAATDDARYPGLLDAVGEQILQSDDYNTEYESTARHAVASFSHGDYRLPFPHKWEQSFDDYSWKFLWACHAIVWGIAQYDAARKAVAA
ncbi:hypothetical protein JBE04_20450 [Streptomyces sp. PRKS01-29]|nr:hypothetical protein [Streptomyces sabulosicollis]MBI0296765.1 hypothetical protein [Streptomyces sabulosicollis]